MFLTFAFHLHLLVEVNRFFFSAMELVSFKYLHSTALPEAQITHISKHFKANSCLFCGLLNS